MLLYRNGTLLNSGDAYISGEQLVVKNSIFNTNEEALYHTLAPGQFLGGYCNVSDFGINYRVAYSEGIYYGIDNKTNSAILVMPTAGSGPVVVWAGWAAQYGQVSITDQFTLTDPDATSETSSPAQNEQPRNFYFLNLIIIIYSFTI